MIRRNLPRLAHAIALALFAGISAADEPAQKVIVTMDFSDGVEMRFTRIAWKEGMTVFDAMRQIERHPRGVAFEHRGSGATAFLTQLGGVKNQGAGGRNWIYRVNGKVADRSFAVCELKSGDEVLWRFGDSEK
jgi:hypothetical protein